MSTSQTIYFYSHSVNVYSITLWNSTADFVSSEIHKLSRNRLAFFWKSHYLRIGTSNYKTARVELVFTHVERGITIQEEDKRRPRQVLGF